MSTQPDKTEVNEALKPIESPPNEENKTALSPRKEEEVTGMEVGTFDSNCSDDILPGGRIPGSNDDTRFVTTRKELWAYYSYYVGNNGMYGTKGVICIFGCINVYMMNQDLGRSTLG